MVVWESSESGIGWWGFLTTEDRHVATGLEGVGFIKAWAKLDKNKDQNANNDQKNAERDQ